MPAILLARLIDAAVEQGFGMAWIEAVIDMPYQDLLRRGATCQISQRLRLLNAIHSSRPIPGLGLLVGRRIQLSDHGIVGYAILSSSTLLDALDIIFRYHTLSNPAVRFRYMRTDDAVVLLETPVFPFEDWQARYHLEEMLAAWLPIGSLLETGAFHFRQLRLTWSRPRHHDLYSQMFNCPILYNQNHCSLTLPIYQLRERITLANPEMALLCEQQCAIIADDQYSDAPFKYQVQRCLLAQPGNFPSLSRVAEQLRISERSLRRHLAEEGTSFREILDALRIRIASRYLRETEISIVTIAGLLGFSAPSNFHRSFKRTINQTPEQYRAHSRAG
jgi:AraC-like DNA-binding protein